MKEDVVDKMIEQYANTEPKIDTITVHKDGEPLLCKNLNKYLSKIAERVNCSIDIYTNGLLLTEDFFKFLSTLPASIRLLVSFHFYNYDGKKNDYRKVVELLSTVNKPSNVEIILATHKTTAVTVEELDLWKNYWTHKRIQGKFGGIHINESINKWTGKVPDGNTSYSSCGYGSGEDLFIGVSGNVVPCCMDLNEDIVFGNIMNDSKEDILNRRDVFLDEMKELVYNNDICRKCTGDYS